MTHGNAVIENGSISKMSIYSSQRRKIAEVLDEAGPIDFPPQLMVSVQAVLLVQRHRIAEEVVEYSQTLLPLSDLERLFEHMASDPIGGAVRTGLRPPKHDPRASAYGCVGRTKSGLKSGQLHVGVYSTPHTQSRSAPGLDVTIVAPRQLVHGPKSLSQRWKVPHPPGAGWDSGRGGCCMGHRFVRQYEIGRAPMDTLRARLESEGVHGFMGSYLLSNAGSVLEPAYAKICMAVGYLAYLQDAGECSLCATRRAAATACAVVVDPVLKDSRITRSLLLGGLDNAIQNCPDDDVGCWMYIQGDFRGCWCVGGSGECRENLRVKMSAEDFSAIASGGLKVALSHGWPAVLAVAGCLGLGSGGRLALLAGTKGPDEFGRDCLLSSS
ncbi:uncharacterized protein VTP21DRAFT_1551 [Calcarisporiella thermophila]|uniref:uncharacterized protein n=1 Tax=Calcarisporiella thermophila TaxID=911321 RepID=UPI0037443A3F